MPVNVLNLHNPGLQRLMTSAGLASILTCQKMNANVSTTNTTMAAKTIHAVSSVTVLGFFFSVSFFFVTCVCVRGLISAIHCRFIYFLESLQCHIFDVFKCLRICMIFPCMDENRHPWR